MILETPNNFDGKTPQEVASQVHSYLWRMVEQLNVAAAQVDQIATFKKEVKEEISADNLKAISDGANNLKSLIIKNAEIIEAEMQSLEVSLDGRYVAVSDFGTYTQNTSSRIEANAESITQFYDFVSEIDANVNTFVNDIGGTVQTMEATVDDVIRQFTTFKNETSAYIKSGIVDYDGATPIYGIAVGQDLITHIEDGEQVVDKQKFRSIFTSQKLGFWQDETEVAYLENRELYVPQIHVLGTIIHGAFKITSNDSTGYSIKWIGA